MHHQPDLHRRSIHDDSHARLLEQLHSDPLMRESLTLLPPVLLFALLHVHTHVGWDVCFAAARQLNNDHGRHMRELCTALSLMKSLRGTRILDPLAWHAALRRLIHAIASEPDALQAAPMQTSRREWLRRAAPVLARSDAARVLRHGHLLLNCTRYWLAARASVPVTWL
ncbi:hypothetical protein [Paraburkholderia azotifigens]|uniref:Uncharacterized protein n=1 Tax=Paraburkholderia azotifigens TaxID=2057004 RepID=A0A5C6VAI1_9BURK|nr:hypothetical protein [Paraburkholderia azotifigens]TXC80645.1 hypothetical protein FRZ40_41070 [Paraburkholderia azotifigens]